MCADEVQVGTLCDGKIVLLFKSGIQQVEKLYERNNKFVNFQAIFPQ
jgi:hypothetical protein